jgi:tetratricopeptide (TPR) repeat protein
MAERATDAGEEVASRSEALALDLALAKARKARRSGVGSALAAEEAFLAAEGRKLELEMHHLRLGHFDRQLTVALKLISGAVGLAIAVGVGAAVWEAVHANSVVVDPFQTPPSLAAQGLNGTVVASGILDELQRMQSETRSVQSNRGFKDAWSSDIKVDVPETGISIGELMKELRRWLGHETHVAGDLVQASDGLRLTVRGDGLAAKSFTGSQGDLPKLTTEAAEYLYGEAEPYLAATRLEIKGRDAEAIQLVKDKFAADRPAERQFLLNAWSNALLDQGKVAEALPKLKEALSLDPNYWTGYSNLTNIQLALGQEEQAWRTGVAFAKAAGRGHPGQKADDFYFNFADLMTWNLAAERDGMIADMEAHGGMGSSVVQNGPMIADVVMRMHEPEKAELYLQTSTDAEKDPFAVAMTHFVHGWGALDRGDWARAAAELEAYAPLSANPSVGLQVPGYTCWLGPAEEMAGHPDKADAAIKAGGRFVDCWRFEGDILDHRGDWVGARKAYADAVALAPDLPAAYYSWGLGLARHSDFTGAEAKYAAANRRGPHWADPLKAWGDALSAQGRFAEAEAKYAEADKYAPKWKQLHYAWGEALRYQGKYAAAIAQYHAVTG